MDDKAQMITQLKDEFNQWDRVLAGLSADQAASILYAARTVKDDVAHLWHWQRISVARMEAAVTGTDPRFEWFPAQFEPESEEDLEAINAWMYQADVDTPWSEVYQRWRDGFLRLIDLAEQMPEADLLAVGKYSWLAEYPLIAVLDGAYDHHHTEHLGHFLEWCEQNEL